MNIKIITYSGAQNWGAILQTYALSQYISRISKEYDCEVIDYNDFDERLFKPRKYLKDIIYSLISIKQNYNRVKRYKNFRDKYINLTKKTFRTIDELKELNIDTDVFITGSDQVWNCQGGVERAFYLEFVAASNIRMSYAASFGITELPNKYKEEIKCRLDRFDFLSVREKSGKKIVSNLLQKKVNVCLDPVFLLDENDWKLLSKDPIEENYIFVYVTEVSKKVDNLVQSYIKRNPGCKVITPYAIPNVKCCVKKDIGPLEFLGYIKKSKYVICTSFHAVAFSLIFETNIGVVPHSSTGARVRDLLGELNLEDHIVQEKKDFLFPELKREKYKEQLNKMILDSKKYLEESLYKAKNIIRG